MSSKFICGRTGDVCPRQNLCDVANEPLIGGVQRITKEVVGGQGKRPSYAGAALVNQLGRLGETMVADLAPNNDDTDATICPAEIIDRGLRGHSPMRIAQGVGFMAAKAVEDVITDLNLRQARR